MLPRHASPARAKIEWLTALVNAALVIAVLVSVPAPVVAQPPPAAGPDDGGAQTFTLEIGGEVRSLIRLAFPKATFAPSLADRSVGEEIEQTLRDDLEFTGIFNTQGPTELSVLALSGEREKDFEQYRSLGNEVVLLATVKEEEGKIVLEGRVYDLPSRQSILGKRYRGTPDQARRLAHSLADDLYRQFTGRPSLALTSIAFQSDRDGANRYELYLMDYDGHNQRRISRHMSTSGFADWSPGGDAIAYMSYYTGGQGVHYVDVASNEKRTVFTQGILNLSPTFSPDGARIAFAHTPEGSSNVDIYICERTCTSPRRLTTSAAIDTNPAWSPDGQQIAFTSDRSGRPHVYVMDTNGGTIRRLSFEGNYNEGACWRPDGAQVTYSSRKGNKFRIAVTSLVDLETRILAEGPDSYETPCFSPDGRRITFTLKRGREAQVYIMNADGSQWRQLTHEGRNMAPDWSPFPGS